MLLRCNLFCVGAAAARAAVGCFGDVAGVEGACLGMGGAWGSAIVATPAETRKAEASRTNRAMVLPPGGVNSRKPVGQIRWIVTHQILRARAKRGKSPGSFPARIATRGWRMADGQWRG